MRRQVAVCVLCSMIVAGCTYTLSETDCSRYRDRLKEWAKAKEGTPEAKDEEAFMKKCPGTVVSRRTHSCMEKSSNEAEFYRCLE